MSDGMDESEPAKVTPPGRKGSQAEEPSTSSKTEELYNFLASKGKG
jgi:hypothetical protein